MWFNDEENNKGITFKFYYLAIRNILIFVVLLIDCQDSQLVDLEVSI